MITQLLKSQNIVIAKYRDLSVPRRSIISYSLRPRQIINPLATDKSRYFARPRPIIVNYYMASSLEVNLSVLIGSFSVGFAIRTISIPLLLINQNSQ